MQVREGGSLSLVQLGQFVAFATCSSVIVYFLTRLTAELKRRYHAYGEHTRDRLAEINGKRWALFRQVRHMSWPRL